MLCNVQMASEQFGATSDTCETWRLRMPNVHDSLLHWATIVHWRNIIYDYMIQHFMNLEELNPSLYSLGFKDKSRSVNSLARVARKHGLPSLANHFINNMYRYPTMEVSEAFAKIQEQCKAYSEAKDQQVCSSSLCGRRHHALATLHAVIHCNSCTFRAANGSTASLFRAPAKVPAP
jgi:phosphatidylinositol kinase/protein kinase (PI-3  family)